jgi:chromosome segregation ATPase
MEKESSKFKIRIDDESPDSQFQEEIDNLSSERLNKRITRISIIIFCLMGAIILAGYFGIKKSLSIINTTGDMEVQTLSKNIESRFSSLSVNQAKLEEAMSKKFIPLEKTTASLQAGLKDVSTAIKYIRSARKADNNKTKTSIAAVEKTLETIPKDLEKIVSSLKKVDQKYSKELSGLLKTVTTIKNDFKKIETDISSLSSEKVDEEALDTALKTQLTAYMNAINQLTSNLEDKIKSLEKMVKEIEKLETVNKRQKQTAPSNTTPSKSPVSKQVPAEKSAKDTITPQPGTIVEQNIE